MFKIYNLQDPSTTFELENSVCNSISNYLDRPIDLHQLTKLHEYVDKFSLNKLRLSVFNDINLTPWPQILLKSCIHQLSYELGPDLLIQKKLNLSIHMPDDELSVLNAHTDCSSGDSPFELVLWIPLTPCKQTNSMFICSLEESRKYYDCMQNGTSYKVNKNNAEYVTIDHGQFMTFPPTLIHGNSINKTDQTRLSLNVRIKSVFSPYLNTMVGDRMFASYYQEWNISDRYKWNKEIFDTFQ